MKDLLKWKAYDDLEPIGGLRGDWQAASICATLTNIDARRRGAKHVFTPREFLLEFKDVPTEAKEVAVPEEPRKSWQEMRMIGMMMAASSQASSPGKRRR